MKLPTPSGIYKYARLVQNTTQYSKKMERLRNRIFTEPIDKFDCFSNRTHKNLKKLPADLDPSVVQFYYPRIPQMNRLMYLLRNYGLYRDEHQDFVEEMTRLRTLRGKGPSRVGEGKKDKSQIV